MFASDTEILIVGAGLVGSALALALGKQGRDVTLIEARTAPAAAGQDVRALALSASTTRILRELDVWPLLAPHAHAIDAIEITDRGGLSRVVLEAECAGLAHLAHACPADRMLASMHEAAAAHSRIDYRTRYVSHRARGEQLEVEVESTTGTARINARLLIAADGSDSTVCAALGCDYREYDYAQSAIIGQVEIEQPTPELAHERFTRSGSLALIPSGATHAVAVQCLESARAATLLGADDVAYDAVLNRRFGARLGRLVSRGPRRLHALVRRQVRRIVHARTVVVGNAANTVHPNGAQGLNLGLRDVAVLAHVLAPAPDVGAAERLADYAARRARDHRAIGGCTDLIAQGFRSRLFMVALGRRLGLGALGASSAARRALILEASGLAALARGRRA